jgi:hypothetical protein
MLWQSITHSENKKISEWIPPFMRAGGGLFTPSCCAADCELLLGRDREGLLLGIDIRNGFRTGGFGIVLEGIEPLDRYTDFSFSCVVFGLENRWLFWDFESFWWYVSDDLIGSLEDFVWLWIVSTTCKQGNNRNKT